MKVLGLNLSHHASAAIIKDGEVFFALENDRLSKLSLIHISEPTRPY